MSLGTSSLCLSQTTNQPQPKFNLKQQNLIPFYIIEDSLKSNFGQIQAFINTQYFTNSNIEEKINSTNQTLKQNDIQYQKQFVNMQKSIFNNIKSQIQTTVSHILNKKLSSIIQTISTFENKQSQKQLSINNQINQMAKTLKFQIAQQNQKYFTKEINKIQKDIDKKVHSITEEKINSFKSFNTFNKINKIKKQENLKDEKQQTLPQLINNQQQQTFNIVSQNLNKQVIDVLKNKVQKLQEYKTQLDKKFIENFSALKSSWKDLGSEMLDNKKLVNKKIEDLNIDVIQLKNLAQFKSLPQTTDQTFKKKIMEKFNEFYSIVSTFTSKAETDMINERTKTIISRHSQQISSLREQFQKNTEYFTFYVNNSNTDDLKQTINKLKQDILKDKKYVNTVIEDIYKHSNEGKKTMEQVVKSLGSLEIGSETLQGKIQKIIMNVEKISDKIRTLQDLNDIDPFKMKKIHSALDHQLNFSDYQPSLNQLQKLNANNAQSSRQLKKQLQQLKDQLFVLTSEKNMIIQTQQEQITQLKNQIKSFNQKLQKVKTQAEEAHLTRKPWIIFNDKQSSQSHSQRDYLKKIQKDSSKKKISLENGKSGGYFANDKSQKNIGYKLSPTPEDKFEVYEKYREKYLSDTLKLPQIFKEKLGGSQEFFK